MWICELDWITSVFFTTGCEDMNWTELLQCYGYSMWICELDWITSVKVKFIPRQAEVAQGVPGRLRPLIFLTFSTTRVVGLQPYAPAAFTPGEIPGTHFQRLSRPQGTWFRREPRKKISSDTTGNRSRDRITPVFRLKDVNMWIGLNYLSVSTEGCEYVNWTELPQCFDYRMWIC
jgi:hypothetical protein